MDPVNPFDFIFHHFGSPEMLSANIAQLAYSNWLTKKIEPSQEEVEKLINASPVNKFYFSHKMIDVDNIISLANLKIEEFKTNQQKNILLAQERLKEAMAKIQSADLTKMSMSDIIAFAEKIK